VNDTVIGVNIYCSYLRLVNEYFVAIGNSKLQGVAGADRLSDQTVGYGRRSYFSAQYVVSQYVCEVRQSQQTIDVGTQSSSEVIERCIFWSENSELREWIR
jgi:hypothetical protein